MSLAAESAHKAPSEETAEARTAGSGSESKRVRCGMAESDSMRPSISAASRRVVGFESCKARVATSSTAASP